MTPPGRRILSAGLAAAVAFAMLCGLGAWQLHRLAWKEALIAALDRELAAAPRSLADVAAREARGEDTEFAKVSLTGRYVGRPSRLLIGTFEGGAGWEVATPFAVADGPVVLVDRGAIAAADRDAFLAADTGGGEIITVVGVIRHHLVARGPFSPDNDAARNNWYWWDLPAMLAASPLPPGQAVLPVAVQLLPEAAAAGDAPRPAPPDAALTNNHLQYAVTWFGLALVLAAVTALFIRGQMKKTAA